jgi:hypothetical protein
MKWLRVNLPQSISQSISRFTSDGATSASTCLSMGALQTLTKCVDRTMILVNQKLSRVLYQVVLTLNRVVLSRLLGHFQVSGTFHPRLHAKIITTTVIFLPYRRHLA